MARSPRWRTISQGNTPSYDPTVEEDSLVGYLLTAGMSLAAGFVIAKAAPKVEVWWKGSAQTALRKHWDKGTRKKVPSSEPEGLESLTPVETEPFEVPAVFQTEAEKQSDHHEQC